MSTKICQNHIPLLKFLAKTGEDRSQWTAVLRLATGCSRAAAAMWLRGERIPSTETAQRLSAQLGAGSFGEVLVDHPGLMLTLSGYDLVVRRHGGEVALPATLESALALISLAASLDE